MKWDLNFLCRFGFHTDEIVHGRRATKDKPAVPTHTRCVWCERETPGWDVGPAPTPRYSGHLTAAEVKRIRRRGVMPSYVTPQVEAELAAMATKAAAARQKRRRAVVVAPLRRSA